MSEPIQVQYLPYMAQIVELVYFGVVTISKAIPSEGFPEVLEPVNKAKAMLRDLDRVRDIQRKPQPQYATQTGTVERALDIAAIKEGMSDLEKSIVRFTLFRKQGLIDERVISSTVLDEGEQAANYLTERPFFEGHESVGEFVVAYAEGALEYHELRLTEART